MKADHKKFIIDNIGTMSEKEIAQKLGLRERKVRKFVENLPPSQLPKNAPKNTSGVETDVDLFTPKTSKKSVNFLIFLGITLLAFVIRFIYLTQIQDSPFFEPFYRGLDDYLYDAWGQSISKGNIVGSDAFYGLPLYPYFLGFIYWFLGHSIFTAKFVQFLIGSVSCGLVFLIGQKVFNRYVGIMAGVIMALFSTAIYFEGFLTSAFLAIFLNALLFLSLLSAVKKPSFPKWIISGLLAGISALANASVLMFSVFVIVWAVFVLKSVQKMRLYLYLAAFLIAIMAAVAPATIHNYVASGEIVPITTHSGITFYAGNNALSDGTFRLPPELGSNVDDTRKNAKVIAERISGRPLKASEVSDFWFAQGKAFIANEPAKYAGILVSKALFFWNAYEIPDILPMSFYMRYAPLLSMPLFSFTLLSPLALLGLFLCIKYIKRAEIQLVFMFILSVFVSTLIYFVNSRYRLIAVPYLAILSGASIYYIIGVVRSMNTRRILMILGIFVVLFAATNFRMVEHSQAQAHNSLGIILKRKGMIDEAIAEYKKAIDIQPNYPSPYFNIALLYQEKGNNKEAIKYLQGALRINPDFPKAHAKIGYSYLKVGDIRKAQFHLKRSLELDPNQPDVRQMLNQL